MTSDALSKVSSARSSRATDTGRSIIQERILNDPARRSALREQLNSDLLPNLPEIPGFHACWLSTTNKSDTIRHRTRLGYVPIDPETDIPAGEKEMWRDLTLTSGEHVGLISVNEMVAYKVPLEIYNEIMTINHHERPLEDEEALIRNQEALAEDLEARGSRLEAGDGMKVDRPIKRPSFAA